MRRHKLLTWTGILGWFACAACEGGTPAAAPGTDASKPAADAPAAPAPGKPMINPHETPEARVAQEPTFRTQQGAFDLTVGDETMHLPMLSFGQNYAVAPEGKKPSISISASEHEGFPSFRIELIGWRPDELKLPLTPTSTLKQVVQLRYTVNENREYRSDDDATRRGENKVTLESYEGNVLSGTFEGTVVPKNASLGEPLKVRGKFTTALRLQGVARADAADKAAPAPDSKTMDAP